MITNAKVYAKKVDYSSDLASAGLDFEAFASSSRMSDSISKGLEQCYGIKNDV